MRRAARRFAEDDGGNVLIMTSLAAPLLFALVGASVDLGSYSLARRSLQDATDSAVSAAFVTTPMHMRERRKRARAMLEINYPQFKRGAKVRTKLRGWRKGKAYYMQYEVRSTVQPLFGVMPPPEAITVRATMRYEPGRDRTPYLVPDDVRGTTADTR